MSTRRFLLTATALVALGLVANQPETAWSIGIIPTTPTPTVTPAPTPAPVAIPNLVQNQSQKAVGLAIADPTINITLPSAPTTKGTGSSKKAAASDPAATTPRRVFIGSGFRQANVPTIPPATAYAPSFGTADPCTGKSASAAGQFPVFGLSFGGTQMDYGCAAERTGNQETIGQKLDFAVSCREDSNYRKAAADIGHPCPVDDPKSASYQPPSHGWFNPSPAQPVAYNPPPPAPEPVPEWCYTATPSERVSHSQCKVTR